VTSDVHTRTSYAAVSQILKAPYFPTTLYHDHNSGPKDQSSQSLSESNLLIIKYTPTLTQGPVKYNLPCTKGH